MRNIPNKVHCKIYREVNLLPVAACAAQRTILMSSICSALIISQFTLTTGSMQKSTRCNKCTKQETYFIIVHLVTCLTSADQQC